MSTYHLLRTKALNPIYTKYFFTRVQNTAPSELHTCVIENLSSQYTVFTSLKLNFSANFEPIFISKKGFEDLKVVGV